LLVDILITPPPVFGLVNVRSSNNCARKFQIC